MAQPASGYPGRPEDPQCYNCGAKGHWAVACPEPTRETPAGLAAWRSSSTSVQPHARSHQSGHKRPNKGPIITKYAPPAAVTHGQAQYPPAPVPSYAPQNPPFPQPAYSQYPASTPYSAPYAPPPPPPPQVGYTAHYPPPSYGPPHGQPQGSHHGQPLGVPHGTPHGAPHGIHHGAARGLPPEPHQVPSQPPSQGPPGYVGNAHGPPVLLPYPPAYPPYQSSKPSDGFGYMPQPAYSPPYQQPSSYGPTPPSFPPPGGPKPYAHPAAPSYKPPTSAAQPWKEPVHHPLPPKPPKSNNNSNNESRRDHRGRRRNDRPRRNRDNRNKKQHSRQQSSNQKSQNGKNRSGAAAKPSPAGTAAVEESSDQISGEQQPKQAASPASTPNDPEHQDATEAPEDKIVKEMLAEETHSNGEAESEEDLTLEQSETSLLHNENIDSNGVEALEELETLPPIENDGSGGDDGQLPMETTSLKQSEGQEHEFSLPFKVPDKVADQHKRKHQNPDDLLAEEHQQKKLKSVLPSVEDSQDSREDVAKTEARQVPIQDTAGQGGSDDFLPPLRTLPPPPDPFRRSHEPRSRNSSVSSRSSDLNSLEAELLGRPSKQRTPIDTDGHTTSERQPPSKPRRRHRSNANSAFSRRW